MTRRVTLALADWPAADRALWDALVARGSPLDAAGPLAHLRDRSQVILREGYARWLGWLAAAEPEALTEPPVARAGMERLLRWMEALGHLAAMSRSAYLSQTLRVLSAADPAADWRRARRLEAILHEEARHDHGQRKQGRILSSAVLVDAGLELAGPRAEAAPSAYQAACRRRDGVMVAMLALMPMRLRAFTALALGSSVQVGAQRILVVLSEEMTKTGTVWEAAVPEVLEPALRHYIHEVRPWLLRRQAEDPGHLWVGGRGRPFLAVNLSQRIRDLTEQLTGVRVTPNFFRDAAATTLARTSPDAAGLTRGLLSHTGFETATRHYNQARAIEAGRDYAEVLRGLTDGEP